MPATSRLHNPCLMQRLIWTYSDLTLAGFLHYLAPISGIRDSRKRGGETFRVRMSLVSGVDLPGSGLRGWPVVSDDILFEPPVEKWRRNASYAQQYLLFCAVGGRGSFHCASAGPANGERPGHNLHGKRAVSDCGPERRGRGVCQGYDREYRHGTEGGGGG